MKSKQMMKNKFVFDCATCKTKCDGKSKGVYIFMNDVEYSEHKEQQVINQINTVEGYVAKKCTEEGYPYVEVLHKPTGTVFI